MVNDLDDESSAPKRRRSARGSAWLPPEAFADTVRASKTEIDHCERLEQLSRDWDISVSRERSDGNWYVRLISRGGMYIAVYIDSSLPNAVARAWAVERLQP